MRSINTQTEFEEDIYKHGRLNPSVNFENCIFNFDLDINPSIYVIHIINCTFNNKVRLRSSCESAATFQNVTFKDSVSFHGFQFKSKTRFHNVNFEGTANFSNANFEDLADFWGSVFFKPTIFYKTDFKKITVFSHTVFKDNVLFTYTSIEKTAIFKGTEFKKGLDLSLAILNGNVSIFNIKLLDYKITDTPKEKETYDDYVAVQGNIPAKNKRETFKLLKTQLLNQGNRIDSLEYSRLEIKAYRMELLKELKRGKIWANLGNFIILTLNTLSNNNGRSWVRGIFFTFIIGILFFSLSIHSTNNYTFSCSSFFKLFFEFLNPAHQIKFLDDFDPNSYTYMWDFIGRSLIAYGIYQTVQAFRKYRNT